MKILAFHAHAGDPLSFLIKAITRSQYCHGAILVDNADWREKIIHSSMLISGHVLPAQDTIAYSAPGQHLIIEAYWPKVRARFLLPSELSEIDVFDVPSLTAAQESDAMNWLIAQITAGVKYDVKDLFRFLPEARAAIGESTDDAYKQQTFCSMLVFNAYRFGGLRLLNCHDYECSPDKLDWSPFAVGVPQLK